MDTQTQIDRLIELAIVQRSELKQLVSELPQLREYLNAEIERTFEETEPQIRTELEEFCRARATDEHAKTGAALAAKVEQLSKQLEVTTAAKYSVLMAERAENANLLAKAEARIEDAASMLTHAVKEIVTDELSRFPRAGEIDQLRKEFAEPRGLNPRGRWMPDETYQRLDLVTINGDSFVSNIDGNRERPSRTAGDWTLSAARGNGGGGGVTSLTDLVSVPSNGQLLIGNGSGFVNSTLTAGTGISISNGAGSITINATDGNITLDDGTAAAPSLNYTNYPTTGLYSSAANAIGFATSGVARAAISSTGLAVTGTITPTGSVHAAAGSVGNPSLAFNADQDTGLFAIGANNLGVAIGGAKVLDVASTGLTVTGALGATSLTSPAATNLTLGTTNSGAAITVLSASNNVGIGTITPAQLLHVFSTGTVQPVIEGGAAGGWPILEIKHGAGSRWLIENGRTAGMLGFFNATNGGQRAGFTDAGNLLIGTTDETGLTGAGGLKINSSTAGSAGAGALVVTGGLATGAASYFGGAATFAGDLSAQRLEAVDAAANNRAATFIRTQNNTTYSSSVLSIQGDRTTSNSSYNLIAAANGDSSGQIAVRDSGNVVNTNNSYGAISDRKLKENIVDATAKLQKLNQVRIVNFNRIGNEQKQIGVIAQELEQIFPSMIEVAIDRDAEGNDLGTTTKTVKYSVFVPMLIKAVQELTARLAALEAK